MCGLIILEICPCVRDVAPQRFLRVVPDLKRNPAGVTGRVTHCVFVVPVTCDELHSVEGDLSEGLFSESNAFFVFVSAKENSEL